MKNILRSFALCTLAAWAPLRAADPQAQWNDLCHVAAGRQLEVTTSDGKTVSGFCVSTTAEELALNSQQRIVKIARSALTRIRVRQPSNRHHLADLGNSLDGSFQLGFVFLFSPYAPLGLAIIPATVVWGAVAAPVCLVRDLGENGPSMREIKVSD